MQGTCVYYAYIRLQAIKAEQAYAAEGGLAGISKFPDTNAASMLGVTPTTPSVPVPVPVPIAGSASAANVSGGTGLQPFNVAY